MAGGEEGPAGGWERTIKHPCARMGEWVTGWGGGGGGGVTCTIMCLDLLLVAILNLSGSSVGKFGFETGTQNGTRCGGLLE